MTALFEIEREVARRCGPYLDDVVAVGDFTWAYSANAGIPSLMSVVLPTLQSSLDLGDEWTGRYLLRRGLLQNAAGVLSAVPQNLTSGHSPFYPTGVLASDRVRRITGVDLATGTVTIDRPWGLYVAGGELIELHYLDPAKELRVAALAGLDRCFVEDRASLATTGQATERDITALASWITTPSQVKNVQWNYVGSYNTAMDVSWFNPFLLNGHVWLSLSADPFPNLMLITARRPISSLATLSASYGSSVSAGISHTTPEVVTAFSAHGLVTGDVVAVSGTSDQTGTWTITVIDDTSFSLDDSEGDGTIGTVLGHYQQVTYSDDLADYPVTLDYAAAAGHCEAWRKFPRRLIGGAQVGLFATQAMAATEFSKQTDANYKPSSERVQLPTPFPNFSLVQRP